MLGYNSLLSDPTPPLCVWCTGQPSWRTLVVNVGYVDTNGTMFGTCHFQDNVVDSFYSVVPHTRLWKSQTLHVGNALEVAKSESCIVDCHIVAAVVAVPIYVAPYIRHTRWMSWRIPTAVALCQSTRIAYGPCSYCSIAHITPACMVDLPWANMAPRAGSCQLGGHVRYFVVMGATSTNAPICFWVRPVAQQRCRAPNGPPYGMLGACLFFSDCMLQWLSEPNSVPADELYEYSSSTRRNVIDATHAQTQSTHASVVQPKRWITTSRAWSDTHWFPKFNVRELP
jgi:hypothetical protein